MMSGVLAITITSRKVHGVTGVIIGILGTVQLVIELNRKERQKLSRLYKVEAARRQLFCD